MCVSDAFLECDLFLSVVVVVVVALVENFIFGMVLSSLLTAEAEAAWVGYQNSRDGLWIFCKLDFVVVIVVVRVIDVFNYF